MQSGFVIKMVTNAFCLCLGSIIYISLITSLSWCMQTKNTDPPKYAGRGRKRKADVDSEAAAVEEKKEKLDGVEKKDEETGQRVVIEHWWEHMASY